MSVLLDSLNSTMEIESGKEQFGKESRMDTESCTTVVIANMKVISIMA